MQVCNIDGGGVRKRYAGGFLALAAGLALAIWLIVSGASGALRLVTFPLFAYALVMIVQARARV